MKSSIHRLFHYVIIAAMLLFLATAARAEDAKAKEKPSVSDSALQFILDKAEKYSAAGENAIAKAVDVATEEAPLVIKEYLTWKTWELGIYTGIGAALILLAVTTIAATFWSFQQGHRWIHDREGYDDSLKGEPTAMVVPVGFLSAGALLAGTITFFHHIGDFLQVALAPRVFLIEQVVNLVK